MSEKNKIGFALVKKACRLCGNIYDGPIVINTRLTVSMAEEIKAMHDNVIGFLRDPCNECKDLMSKGFLIIGVIEEKTDDKDNPWRSGHQWVLSMDEAREIFTKDVCDKGAAFIDVSLAKDLGLPVVDVITKAEL